jgi:hypothetical protein
MTTSAPLARSRAAERGRTQSVLQTAQPTVRLLFGRHDKSTGLAVSSLSPRGDGDAGGIEPPVHRQTGRLGSGLALGPNACGVRP